MKRKYRPARDADFRTLSQFRREVRALLIAKGMSGKRADGLIHKWRKFVRLRWQNERPPCSVSDHITRFERERVVEPYGMWITKRSLLRHRKKTERARDADNPRVGEIFETSSGNRWEVLEVDGERVLVRRAGHRNPGELQWKRTNLRGLRSVNPVRARVDAAQEVPEEKPGILARIFTPERDPSRRKVKKKISKKKASKKITVRRCKKPTVVQSILFDRKVWTLAKARRWAKSHGFKDSKVDVTEASYRIRQISPSKIKVVGQKIFKKGIKAVIGCRS